MTVTWQLSCGLGLSKVDIQRRVVITGFGLVSPLGLDVDRFWQRLVSGESAIRPFENLPQDALPVSCGGQCVEFTGAAEEYGPVDGALKRNIRKNQKVMAREIEMGVAAAQRAIFHSGVAGIERDPDRYGVSFASDLILTRPEEFIDGVKACHPADAPIAGPVDLQRWPVDGLPQVNPLWLLKYLPNMPASHVAIFNDFRGPNNSLTVREAGHNLVIGESISVIRRGWADCMVVGATGSRIHPLRSVHTAMQEKLAAQRSVPAEMARPFDRTRDGVVLGEGAGAIVLERMDKAQQRGARIWGEVIGSGSSMAGLLDGADRVERLKQGLVRAVEAAFRNCPKLPNSLHFHAHGAGSTDGDLAEAQAIRLIAEKYGLGSVPVVAAKSYFGSLGAGSAAVELISSLLALEHGHLFDVLNFTQGDDPKVQIASKKDAAGDGFVHLSYTPQGQISAVVVQRFAA